MKITDKDIHVLNAVWTEWRRGLSQQCLQHFYSVLRVDPGLKVSVSDMRYLAKAFGWRDTSFQDVYVR